MNIRKLTTTDLPAIAPILDDTELFPAETLEEMSAPYFHFEENGGVKSDLWLVCEFNAQVVGFAYARAEPLTEGTWNLLALGFRQAHQGSGYGAELIAEVEQHLKHERILIVETSGTDDFAASRAFYIKCGYECEATIRDYWSNGDDKVTYRKALEGNN